MEQFGERAYWTNPSYPGARWDESLYNLDFATHRLFGGGAGVRHTEQISLGLLMKLQKRVALFGKVSVVRLMPLSLQAVSQLTLSMLRIRTGMISLLRQL